MPMSIERLTQILKAFGRARFGRRSEKLGSLTTGGSAARTDLTGGRWVTIVPTGTARRAHLA
ncbi:hypothetical protein [Sinorhizobium meliloti]|uniref:hypothetical protein n=1 Tax=Rhizobium meliloti TaxID=382 RepID=UPI00268C373C